MIITIDGPAASGKSSAARLLAQKLGYCHLNSGLLYRALAYLLMDCAAYDQLSIGQPQASDVDNIAQRLRYTCDAQGARIFFDGKDITDVLKGAALGNYASIVGVNTHVRKVLLEMQRAIAREYDLVVDGRDAGSAVFPSADYKFFLTASIKTRAARFKADQERQGIMYTQAQAEEQLRLRDARDQGRVIAPLMVPQGAILIDNSQMSLEETVNAMLSYLSIKK